MASAQDISECLAMHQGETRKLAETYIRNAPAQVHTPYRAEIEARLGWIPTSSGVKFAKTTEIDSARGCQSAGD